MRKPTLFQRIVLCGTILALLCPTLAACKKDPETETCDHANADWVIVQEPTDLENGTKVLTCPDCQTMLASAYIPSFTDPAIETLKTTKASSIVKVIGYDESGAQISAGTGFFVAENGTFLTNAHVIENCHFVQICDHTGQIYNANALLAYKLSTSDYAILRIAEEVTVTPMAFTESVSLNSKAYALGYPNDTDELCVSDGILASELSAKYYLSTVEITNGNSGGPLTTSSGYVIGLVTASMQNGSCMVLKYSDFKTPLTNALAADATPIRELPIRPTA